MNLEKTKILIINSRKDQLAQTASILSRSGYEVLISASRTLGYKIAREKEPMLVLHYINNVNELPDKLNVTEVKAISASIVVVDIQELVSVPKEASNGFALWQGPRGADELLEQIAEHLHTSLSAANHTAFVGKRVLVIDDELMNQTYYQEVIKGMGLQCEACGDLKNAEALLQETDYDLVITDVMLGQTIGLVITKVIAKLKRKSQLIVVTGLSGSEFEEQFGEFECAAILHKPINPLHLKNTVRSVLLNTKLKKVTTETAGVGEKSRYNPERAFALLKHNEANIREVMTNFGMYLTDSINVITTVNDISRLKYMRKPFHDLGNLCYYFGAEVLFDMIGKYSVSQNEQVKFEMLPQIEAELKLVSELHKKKNQ